MKKLKVRRTTYEVSGCQEPCIMVGEENDFAQVRIATCYHLIGDNTLYVEELLDGKFNGMEEINGDFESLTDDDARRIAKEYSAYIR